MEKAIKHAPADFSANLELFKEKIGDSSLTLPELSDWEFVETGEKPFLNLKEKGKDNYLHYPESLEEEESFWLSRVDFSHANLHVIYGIGLGHYFYAIKELLEEDSTRRLIFLEDDPQILRAFLETDKAQEILAHPQVNCVFCQNEQKLLSLLENQFIVPDLIGAHFSVLLYYAKRKPENCNKLNFVVGLLSSSYLKKIGEYGTGGDFFFKNYFSNFLNIDKALYGPMLYRRFEGIPAIICGAGPSLEKNAEVLKGLKNKALIFAGGTAMNALNAQGILPHFGAGIDPFETQLSRILENNAFLVPYFANLRMNREGLEAILGEEIFLPTDDLNGYPLARRLEKDVGISEPDPLDTGFNVINYTLAIAERLGCNPILCVGLDLAYTGGKSYAPKVQVHGTFDLRRALISKPPNDELVTAKDIYGQPVQTLYHWMMESEWYGRFKSNNSALQIYNCTEGGIGLAWIENIPLKEAADRFLKKEFNLDEKVREEFKRAREYKLPEKAALRKVLHEFSEELSRFLKQLKKLNPEGKRELIDKEAASQSRIAAFLGNYLNVHSEERKYPFLEKTLLNLELKLLTALMDDIPDLVTVLQPNPPAGQPVYYYEDGKTIQAILPGGKEHLEGVFQYFYRTGQLKRSIEYHRSLRSGWDRYYSERGVLLREIEYEEGLPKGIGRIFDQQGNLLNEIRYSAPGVVSEYLKAERSGELVPETNLEGGYAKYAIDKSDQMQGLLSKLGKAISMVKQKPDQSVDELNRELVDLERLLKEMKTLGGMDAANYKEALWGSRHVFSEIAKQFEGLSKELGFKTEKLQEALKKLLEKQNDGKT